jgi:hypothetical protein
MNAGEPQLADTANLFLVGADVPGGRVVIGTIPLEITRAQALNLVVWIIALVDPDCKDFHRLYEALKNS